ncbi:MBL fold metallo-hydrolase [Ekhidna sp.]
MRFFIITLLLLIVQSIFGQHIIVLGTAQDGGFPHIGCQNECQRAHRNPDFAKYVTSLALVDPKTKQWWLFEATPDMDKQLQYFQTLTHKEYPYLPEGIFITHAHIGHYTGLMSLGREALGANKVKVYALPRMIDFLKTNGPWSQLIDLENISPVILPTDLPVVIGEDLTVEAFTVPHRDEFSETAGFKISKRLKSYLFIPDIDKWRKWDRSIVELLDQREIDYAFLDATFYQEGELPNRAMDKVPHPFVVESMALFDKESRALKRKIQFIHFNHTNPLLFDKKTQIDLMKEGYGIAEQGKTYY